MAANLEPETSQQAATAPGWFAKNALWLVVIITALGAAAFFATSNRSGSMSGFTPTGQLQGDPIWDAAVAKASSTNRPILLDFTASWCPPCKMMEAEVFPQPQVKNLLNNRFVFAKADVSDSNSSPGINLGMIYQVEAIPTYLVVDTTGKVIDSKIGYIPADDFTAWLEEVAANYTPPQAAPSPSESPSESPTDSTTTSPEPVSPSSPASL